MFRSAVVRLTIWYACMFVGLSVVFSGALYLVARRELSEGLQDQYRAMDHGSPDRDHDYVSTTRKLLDDRTAQLALDFIYFNGFMVLLASGAGYVLARKTLGPLEAAHEAQVNFTAEASHELRTPLAAMKADSEATLLDPGATREQLSRTLRQNVEDIDRLSRLATSLLELTRGSSAPASLREPVSMDEVVRQAVKGMRGAAKKAGIFVTMETVEVKVMGNAAQLERMATVLIENAVKYSHQKDVVRVELSKLGSKIRLEVQDNGVGISPHDLPHVFERFYRASPGEHRSDGYGLGLAIALEIATSHHGQIKLTSSPNAGTIAVVTLPQARLT